jgi:hypothetical protein
MIKCDAIGISVEEEGLEMSGAPDLHGGPRLYASVCRKGIDNATTTNRLGR